MRRFSRRGLGWSLALAAAVCGGCGRAPNKEESTARESMSPTARPDLLEALRADLDAPRHPSDGGGRVRFVEAHPTATAGMPGSWSFLFETGPLGIVKGGWLFFQAPPFWEWSTPQVLAPELSGYTEVVTTAEGVELEAATLDQQLLGIQIGGRDLQPGETVEIRYGAGAAGAMADRFAEDRSCFFFAVDGDADGVRALLDDLPCLDVGPGPLAMVHLTVPSTARPGTTVPLVVALLDRVGNRIEDWTGLVELRGDEGVEVPEQVEISATDAGSVRLQISVSGEGVHRVSGRIDDEIAGLSNPMVVGPEVERLLWADLHGHSGLSDGTGTPKDYFRYARDVSALDVVALTDHDHWGMRPLAIHPELWEEIRRETELFHDPGRFVTLLGYEWTNWIHGHRHVLYFSDQGRVLSSVAEEYETPQQLWAALRGQDVLTFAHHSAGGPVATNWQIPPDPELEPVTEITSVHGSSEALDSPMPIYSPVPGNFVRDVLDRGYRLGFVGSGDGHDGHPGLSYLAAPNGGLAAIMSPELTRNAVKQALVERRVYATNGPRIVLQASLAGRPMGTSFEIRDLRSNDGGEPELRVDAVGEFGLERIDIVRSGRIVETVACDGEIRCATAQAIDGLEPSEYLYVRVVQLDGGAAWSSPFFID